MFSNVKLQIENFSIGFWAAVGLYNKQFFMLDI